MAYTKKLATIIITTLDGGTFNVADTLECPAATSALASLQNSNGAYVKVGDDTYYVPSSAVANIKVTYSDSEEITPSNPC